MLIFSRFVRLKNVIFVSEWSEDTCLVKNGSNMYLGDDGEKELVIICDHVYFFHRNEWTKDGGAWQNQRDTDTGNEWPVRCLTFC